MIFQHKACKVINMHIYHIPIRAIYMIYATTCLLYSFYANVKRNPANLVQYISTYVLIAI